MTIDYCCYRLKQRRLSRIIISNDNVYSFGKRDARLAKSLKSKYPELFYMHGSTNSRSSIRYSFYYPPRKRKSVAATNAARASARRVGRRPWRRSEAMWRPGPRSSTTWGAHTALVDKLALKSQRRNTKLLKGLPDGQNPLGPVTQMCHFMLRFLKAHPGFNRGDTQG